MHKLKQFHSKTNERRGKLILPFTDWKNQHYEDVALSNQNPSRYFGKIHKTQKILQTEYIKIHKRSKGQNYETNNKKPKLYYFLLLLVVVVFFFR